MFNVNWRACGHGKGGKTDGMSKADKVVPGQRWSSETEPELGLGVVLSCQFGRIELKFPAVGETRLFALATAPLRRVRFEIGDAIQTRDGRHLHVEGVEQADHLLNYRTSGGMVPEGNLADTIRFSKPEERLLAGITDDLDTFRLRAEALEKRAALRRSPARGFLGARIELLPHQVATAESIALRPAPRVLLADEVGLGKTIEACLILHRMLLTRRAERVLIVVPESLIHQWFIELLRRFNLSFSLYDAERFASLRRNGSEENPFLDEQWVLASQDFLVSDLRVASAVVDAGWDILVVDEAHHLEWTPKAASPAYALVELLARATPTVLLLTATPEQLGAAGHFARLRLLDPDRYADLDDFLAESTGYQAVADLVEAVEQWEKPQMTRTEFLKLVKKARAFSRLAEVWKDAPALPTETVASRLIDAFGPGRVLFRSTRAALGGFPSREVFFHELLPADDPFLAKVRWLVGLLKELGDSKILLIAHTREAAEKIVAALGDEIRLPVALFHEGLTLLQRDRQAAYFADADGARILVCSEIGSEGRNFQFSHHLVLFDLPEAPELLEQRIGRLDRIGQVNTICLHVPIIQGSREKAWARWYHEGLNAFERCLPAGHDFGERFGPRLAALKEPVKDAALKPILVEAKKAAKDFRAQLSSGRDRLLGLHPEARRRADKLIKTIEEAELPASFEDFAVRLLDASGLVVDELTPHRYWIEAGVLTAESFPGLPEGGMSVCMNRMEAVSREDLVFFSADHPLFSAAFDAWLGSENGNSGFALWPQAEREGIFLEIWFVVETVAPKRLHLDRFLPPTPIRIIVDHSGELVEEAARWKEAQLINGDPGPLLERGVVKRKLIPSMLEAARRESVASVAQCVASARARMDASFEVELSRLRLLSRLNDHVRPDEITRLETEWAEMVTALDTASARSDSVRLIWAQA